MQTNDSIINFRCKHRHSALSHPKCYFKYLQGDQNVAKKFPKVLVFDIETSPLQAYIFQKSVWKANVGSDQVISEWFMLTWTAKWLLDDQIITDALSGKEAIKEDDKRIVHSLWKLLDEADIVIAHNGDGFDIPNMNTRFIIHGFPPPSPYQTIDTMLIAKKQFGFTHNGLDALAKIFGFESKLQTSFELWKRCVAGDDEALKYMQKYNNGDVELLENIYMKLRPWIKAHPNLGLYLEENAVVCPNCGNSKVKWPKDKFYYTQVSKYPLFQCECGAWGRARKSTLDKKVSQSLGVGLSK